MLAAMRRHLFGVVCILLSAWCVPARLLGQSISLTDVQRKKLAEIVRDDPEAGKLFEKLKHAADEALAATPDPIDKIQTEGKLPADPARLKSQQSLKDMPRMDALGYAYAVTGSAEYADKARQFILAWAKVNHSAGDPIDDTNLESPLVAYDLTRGTFSAADRETADAWLREVVAAEQETAKKHADNHHNNWHSHRLKIVSLIAFLLHDQPLIDHTVAAYKDQVDHNLLPDGSSYDFHERDALHYHIYDITPLLALAIAARNNGIDLYSYQSPNGGSLGKRTRNSSTPRWPSTASGQRPATSTTRRDRLSSRSRRCRRSNGRKCSIARC
jgi:hypothetical protein